MIRRWVVGTAFAGLGMIAGGGCPSSANSFECSTDGDCGAMGRCEVTGFCSFPDTGCESGYRYGEFANALSDQCVVDETGTTTTSGMTMTTTGPSTTDPSTTVDTISTTTTDPSSSTSDPSTTSVDTGSTTFASSSSSDTTEDIATTVGDDCQLDDFDGDVPGAPDWFTFSTGANPLITQGGSLILDVTVDDGQPSAIAGIRTVEARDFSIGFVQVVLEQVPALGQATTGFNINDEVFDNQDAIGFGFVDGELRVQTTVKGTPSIVTSMNVEPAEFPLTLTFEVPATELVLHVLGTTIDEDLHTMPVPTWFDDAYVSLDAGNPTDSDPMGVTAAGVLRVCGFLN